VAGRYLYAVAHNREVRPVQERRGRRSFGSQRALGRSGIPADELDAVLAALVDRVTRRSGSLPDGMSGPVLHDRPMLTPNVVQLAAGTAHPIKRR